MRCGACRRCVDGVGRAAEVGGTRINFTPTMYWVKGGDGTGTVAGFCYMT